MQPSLTAQQPCYSVRAGRAGHGEGVKQCRLQGGQTALSIWSHWLNTALFNSQHWAAVLCGLMQKLKNRGQDGQKHPQLHNHTLFVSSGFDTASIWEQLWTSMKYRKRKTSSEFSDKPTETSLKIAGTAIKPDRLIMAEADVGSIAAEAEPSHQYSITFGCHVTDSSRGAD